MKIEEIKEVVDLSLVESIKAKDKRIEELDKVNSLLQLRLATQEDEMQRKVAQAREEGELLAYNCEKRLIQKACEWLEANRVISKTALGENTMYPKCFIDMFRNAMKGE